ncbi:hypothetical protein FGO68_gene15880 [Halteria grandinella]|uniref:Uncharacterized protein n=1 Tax=Halteria grandinella TaxID=5974 RepID=A0A8J8NIA6_HALGN|nr:hypothetical protein FGO68_gene15880 [Halteria grandinella]
MNSLKSIRAIPNNPYQTGRASSVLQTHQQQHKNILKLNEYGTPNTLSQARRSSLKNASNPYLGRLGVFEGSKKSMNMSGALTESTQKRVRINDKPIVSDLNDVSTARLKFDEASSNKVAAETTTSSNVKYTSMFTDSPRNHEPKLQATQKKSLYKSPGDYQSRLLKLHQAASVGVVPLTQPSLPFLQNTQVDNSILLKSRNKMKQHNSMLVESQAKDTPPLIPAEASCGSLIKIRGLINTRCDILKKELTKFRSHFHHEGK